MGKLRKHLDEVVNPLWNAAERCVTQQDHHMNAALGLAGEAGEVADIHKKYYFHRSKEGNPYRAELLLEMGDVMYYWLKVKDLWGFTTDEILQANREKLFARYADKAKNPNR